MAEANANNTTNGYVRRCARCGRMFRANHANEKFCNLPSLMPEDHGKTCKAMRRIESKHEERDRGRELKRRIECGENVLSTMYGCISRSEYLERFHQYLMEKYNIHDYAALQKWGNQNPELKGTEYSEFQEWTGLQNLDFDN